MSAKQSTSAQNGAACSNPLYRTKLTPLSKLYLKLPPHPLMRHKRLQHTSWKLYGSTILRLGDHIFCRRAVPL